MRALFFVFSLFFIVSCGDDNSSGGGAAVNQITGLGHVSNAQIYIPQQGYQNQQPYLFINSQNYMVGQQSSQQAIQYIYQLYYGQVQVQPVSQNQMYRIYRVNLTGSMDNSYYGNGNGSNIITVQTIQAY